MNKVNSHDCHVGFCVNSAVKVLHHRRLITLLVCDAVSVTILLVLLSHTLERTSETTIHSQVERLTRLTYILKGHTSWT